MGTGSKFFRTIASLRRADYIEKRTFWNWFSGINFKIKCFLKFNFAWFRMLESLTIDETDRLGGLSWDGSFRLSTWFEDGLRMVNIDFRFYIISDQFKLALQFVASLHNSSNPFSSSISFVLRNDLKSSMSELVNPIPMGSSADFWHLTSRFESFSDRNEIWAQWSGLVRAKTEWSVRHDLSIPSR